MKFLHRDALPVGSGLVQIAFTGKGVAAAGEDDLGRVVGDLLPAGVEAAWLQQVHSADVAETETPGSGGRADALVTDRAGLGLSVVTADCVPVLLAGRGAFEGDGRPVPQIAAVHAGWRGIAAGIVGEAASRFAGTPRVAWIGPAISAAAYEVGPEVAQQVADGSDDSVLSIGRSGREHVDLRRAAEIQLRRLGVEDIRHVDRCTFGDDSLWSYRRDGSGAGRNLSVIWIEP